MREKFRANAGLSMTPEDVEALEEAIMTLERQRDLRGFEVLARASRRQSVASA